MEVGGESGGDGKDKVCLVAGEVAECVAHCQWTRFGPLEDMVLVLEISCEFVVGLLRV